MSVYFQRTAQHYNPENATLKKVHFAALCICGRTYEDVLACMTEWNISCYGQNIPDFTVDNYPLILPLIGLHVSPIKILYNYYTFTVGSKGSLKLGL
jgi:hypothetical protein